MATDPHCIVCISATDPHWTTYLTALLTPCITIFGLYFAIRQWITSREKLKLDLFNKRFVVYETCTKLMSKIISKNGISDIDLDHFRIGTNTAKWLFNEQIEAYLKAYGDKSKKLVTLYSRRNPSEKNLKEIDEISEWFLDQISVLDIKFSPFLKLKH